MVPKPRSDPQNHNLMKYLLVAQLLFCCFFVLVFYYHAYIIIIIIIMIIIIIYIYIRAHSISTVLLLLFYLTFILPENMRVFFFSSFLIYHMLLSAGVRVDLSVRLQLPILKLFFCLTANGLIRSGSWFSPQNPTDVSCSTNR